MQAWSEMVGGMTEVILVMRPFVITKSNVCPLLWVDPDTCCTSSIESSRLRNSVAVASEGLSTWILKSPQRMNLSNWVCRRDRSSVNSSMKEGWCLGR